MEFMLVLYEDPELVATEQQRSEAVQRVGEYAMGLVGDGTLKGGAPLHPVTEAKKIRTREGARRVLDGPFAEAKEVIAGFFVIEAPAPTGRSLSRCGWWLGSPRKRCPRRGPGPRRWAAGGR